MFDDNSNFYYERINLSPKYSLRNEKISRKMCFLSCIIEKTRRRHLNPYQKNKTPRAHKKRCQVFPPGALPRGGNCVELASGGLAGAALSREIDL